MEVSGDVTKVNMEKLQSKQVQVKGLLTPDENTLIFTDFFWGGGGEAAW